MWSGAVQRSFRKTPVAMSLLLVFSPSVVLADSYYNPAFLTDFKNTGNVADLSRFEKNQQAPGTYRVDVYLNDEYLATRDVQFNAAGSTEGINGKPGEASDNSNTADGTGLIACLTVKTLENMGVNIRAFPALASASPDSCVDLPATIKDASSTFDFERLRLNISIPQAALNNTARGYIPPEQWDNGIPALLMNYNFTGSHNSGDYSSGDNYFLSLNGGLNLGAWRLRDTSNWSYNSGSHGQPSQNDWEHISTYVERAIVPLKGELTIGDSNTPSDIFDSLSFRGVQLASDDNMLPDSLKGFAPTIRGIAKSNAQVTIRQNGYTIYQSYVPPGAFAITDLYPTASSGDLTVSVKEADGSVSSYVVPYSTVPILQREGRLKYALTAGRYRSGGGNQDDPDFFQGTLIWGGPAGFTLYGGTQYAENYNAYTLGLGKNLGDWGGVSADVTQANSTLADDSDHHGQSIRFLYAKSLNAWGTNFQLLGYRYSTEGFYTLSETTYKFMDGYNYQDDNGTQRHTPSYTDYYNLYYTKRGKIQANLSQSVGRSGSLFVTASQQTYWHTDETTTLVQAGYNGRWDDISYGINYSYNKAQQQREADQIFSFNISLPLSKWLSPGGNMTATGYSNNSAYATYSNSTDTHGNMTQQAGISGTLLKDNNLNYTVQQGYSNHEGGGYTGLASMDYRGTYGNANVSYNYGDGYRQLSYGASGGVVLHQNGLTLGQPLGETNVLIAAPGADGVDVENNSGVKTDWRGYAVVPYATDYRLNRIALNTNSLDNHTDIDEAVTNVVPTKGALVRASFKARVGVRAMLRLTHDGKPLPFGSMVSLDDNDNAGIVGDDGQVYLSGLPLSGKLKVQWGEGAERQCQSAYTLPEDSLNKAIVRSGLDCQ
ncbi:fimbrial biogenesis usher protein [Klebsiella aerogenes]|uniref:fimbrial biogenesis usher protein n=1 Tax=Klebsiella aerogenes TaxID=548 RepID=UPI001F3E0690